MSYKSEIIHSNRKSIAIEIKRDLTVIIRAPLQMKDKDIQQFIYEKTAWIEEHLKIMQRRIADESRKTQLPKLTPDELAELTEKARKIISERAAYYAASMGVRYNKIAVRHQVSRWGSCSSKNNLNFNCLLILCPPEILDYVVVHELCHLKEMNHSPRFWAEVEKIIPDYRAKRNWLKNNGGDLIRRLK